MKKKYLIIPAFAVLALFGTGTAFAYGGPGKIMPNVDPATFATHWGEQMQQQADLLGITLDELKADWAAGKTFQEIVKEKGISQADLQAKMKAARLAQQTKMLQVLVDQGKITSAQAEARLKVVQSLSDNSDKKMNGKHQRGFGMMGR